MLIKFKNDDIKVKFSNYIKSNAISIELTDEGNYILSNSSFPLLCDSLFTHSPKDFTFISISVEENGLLIRSEYGNMFINKDVKHNYSSYYGEFLGFKKLSRSSIINHKKGILELIIESLNKDLLITNFI